MIYIDYQPVENQVGFKYPSKFIEKFFKGESWVKYHTTTDASNNQGKLKARIEFVRDCLLGVNQNLNYTDE